MKKETICYLQKSLFLLINNRDSKNHSYFNIHNYETVKAKLRQIEFFGSNS